MDTDSDVSDLSSLSESEPEYTAPQKKKVPKKRETQAFEKPALRPPRASNYSVASIYHDLTQGYIDLEPEYQRAEVWSENKQMALLDSLLNNYYIPPIILAVEGPQSKRCIDGKQRMTSIQKFLDGKIALKDSVTNQKVWWKSSRSSVKILDEKARSRLGMMQILCVEYDSISEDQEREIFQRVQNGMPLTPQERLQAYNGEYPSFIREVQHILEDAEITNDIQWDTTRGKSFASVAQIVFLVKEDNSKHAPPEPGTGKLEKWLSDANEPVPANIRDRVKRTVNVYTTLIHTQGLKESLGSGKHARLSPIEFVLFGYMIFVYKGSLSLVQLSSAIDIIRTRLKAAYQDRRFNTRQYKWFLAEIAKVCGEPHKLKSDGKGDKSADSQVQAIKTKEEKVKAKAAQANAAKKEKETPKEVSKPKAKARPRPVDSSDMDEGTPLPRKATTKAPAKTNKRKRILSSDSDSDDDSVPKNVVRLKKPVVNSQMAKRTKPAPATVTADITASISAPSKLTARRPRKSIDMDTSSSTQVENPPTKEPQRTQTAGTPVETPAVRAPDSPVLLGPSLSRTPHSPMVRVKPEPKDDDNAMLLAMKDTPSAPIAAPTTSGTPAQGMPMDPNILAMMQWAWYASQQPQAMAGYVPGQTPMPFPGQYPLAGQFLAMGQHPVAGQYPATGQPQNIGQPPHAQTTVNPQMAPPRMSIPGQATAPQPQPPASRVLPAPATGQGSAPGQASFGQPLAFLAPNGSSLPPRPTTNQPPSAPPPFFSNPPPNIPRRPDFNPPSSSTKRALSPPASAPPAPRSMRTAESISTPYRRSSPDYGPVKPEPVDDPQGWNAFPMPPPMRQPDSGWPKRGRARSRSRDRGRNGDASSSRRRSPSRGRKSSRSRSRSVEYIRSKSRRDTSPRHSGRGYSDRGLSPPPRSGYRDKNKEKSSYRGKSSSSKYRRSDYGGRYDYD